MHAAGIEVILDVVYNHTAEGNHMEKKNKITTEEERRSIAIAGT